MQTSTTMTEVDEIKKYSPVTDFCRSFVCEKIKLVLGACIVNLLVVVVFVGVAKGYCVLQIPAIVNFILLFLALTLLAYCEALHYAIVSIEKWDMSEVYAISYCTHQTFSPYQMLSFLQPAY